MKNLVIYLGGKWHCRRQQNEVFSILNQKSVFYDYTIEKGVN